MLALHDEGLHSQAIAKEVGVHSQRVLEILKAHGETSKTPIEALTVMRNLSPEVWERRFAELADKHATVAEKAMDKANEVLSEDEIDVEKYDPRLAAEMLRNQTARLRAAKDLALAGAVATDKALLLTGRATQKVEIDVHSADFREALKIQANIERMNSLRDEAIDVKEIPPAE